MRTNTVFRKLALGGLISALSLGISLAAGVERSFSGGRITVESVKSFPDVSDSIKKLVAKNGMMVMAEVDQGKMLSMTGLRLNAKLFLIGNPNVGKKLFAEDHGVGLYVPLRIFVYSDEHGKTFVAYDKPSALLSQFQNEQVAMVAKMLDEKLAGLAGMAAK